MNTKKLTKLSLLTAIALILFIVELRLPNLSPISGVKLGLANVVTVYAVYQYKPSEVAMMLLVRILLGAIFSGNMVSLLYSLAGGVLCLVGMLLLKKIIPEKYMCIASIFGAILHNTGQIAMAVVLMGSLSVVAYYPILLLSGCIAGFFTGITAQYINNRAILKRKDSSIQ
jgi:heptaprenyl diphosphate synthase